MAAFHNPEFYAKQGMRLSTYDVPRIISCSDLFDDYLAVPRGCEDDIIGVLNANNVNYIIEDKTCYGREINVSFKGELREEQQKAMEYMIPHNTGTLSAGELTNGYKIRRAAIDLNVPLITNSRLASAFISAFCNMPIEGIAIKSWSEYK